MHCGADLSATEPAASPAPENILGGQESTEVEWLQVLDGSTFMLSDRRGDVMGGSIAGMFHEDTGTSRGSCCTSGQPAGCAHLEQRRPLLGGVLRPLDHVANLLPPA